MSGPNDFTIADVAKAAGVSVSTVSRILNSKQDVAAATRVRVQHVIDEMGFTPHAQAQSLRAGRTRNIALLFPMKYPGETLYNSLELDFVLGAAAASGEREYFFNLLPMPVTPESLLSLFRGGQVDGVVLMQIHIHDWRVDLLRESGYPFVMIGHCADNTGLSFIDADLQGSVRSAFDHVVSLGHHIVGYIGIPAQMRQDGFGPAVREWDGYQQSLEAHQLQLLAREPSYAAAAIYQAALELLDEQPGLTAFVTAHEFGALSITQALHERGRAVPDDCSLIAVTTERIADLTTPPVTHMDFPSYTMGYRAIDQLIRQLEGEQATVEQIMIPPRLVTRNSTAPVKARSNERSAQSS